MTGAPLAPWGSGAGTSLKLRLGAEITGAGSTAGIGADSRELVLVEFSAARGALTPGFETGMPEVALRAGTRSFAVGAALPLQAGGFVAGRSLTEGTGC